VFTLLLDPGLAAATEPYVTSLIYCHDPVPRLTPAAVQRLRVELLKVDWAAQLKSSLLEAEYTQVRHASVVNAILYLRCAVPLIFLIRRPSQQHSTGQCQRIHTKPLFVFACCIKAVLLPLLILQAITAAIDSASANTAEAAAQLQKLAGELLQSKHIQTLTNTLNIVVYGRQGSTSAAAAAGDGDVGRFAAQHLQQLQEEEQQWQQQWQQQGSRWQQKAGGGGEQQQQVLQAWQADVIRSWVDDVSVCHTLMQAGRAYFCLVPAGPLKWNGMEPVWHQHCILLTCICISISM
jgi:hypothetical protein